MDASRIGGPPPHGQSAPSGDPARRKRGGVASGVCGWGEGEGGGGGTAKHCIANIVITQVQSNCLLVFIRGLTQKSLSKYSRKALSIGT